MPSEDKALSKCESKHQEIVAARQQSYRNGLKFKCPLCQRVVYGIEKKISKNLSVWIVSKVILLFLILPSPAFALTEAEVLPCVIGEAAGEGYEGMVAVSEGIRNRGHLRGVYGCTNGLAEKEPAYVWERARSAWRASKDTDLVKGADHWENIERYGENYWTRKGEVTAKIGSHTFFVLRK